ncbi:MAG: metalloregulator ArsR/SmtB family transcription factor [bacterium]
MNEDLLLFVKAIGEPKRLLILNYLRKECCVGELWKKLGLPQNLTSHHLRVLKEAKLIDAEKRGVKIVYKLNEKYLNKAIKNLQAYLK